MIPKMIPIFVEFILSLYKSISYKRVQRRLGTNLNFPLLFLHSHSYAKPLMILALEQF